MSSREDVVPGCALNPKKFSSKKSDRGFLYVSAARGAVVIFGTLFASVAINEYAISVADCKGKIFNGSIKASSILGVLGTVEGVMNALLSPFLGTFADLTPHRKTMIGGLILGFTVLVFAQSMLFLSEDIGIPDPRVDQNVTDLTLTDREDEIVNLRSPLLNNDLALTFLVVSVVLQVVAYEITALLTNTYAPELAPTPKRVTKLLGLAFSLLNGMQLLLVVFTIGASFTLGLDSLTQGLLAGILCCIITLSWFVPGYPMLPHRRDVAEGLKTGCCGMGHFKESLGQIFTEYKQLRLFLFGWMAASASMQSITILATTYLTFHLGFSGALVSAVLGGALLFVIPGSLMAGWVVKKVPLVRANVICFICFGLSFIVAPFVLTSEPKDFDIETEKSKLILPYGQCEFTLTQDFDALQDPELLEEAIKASREATGIAFFAAIGFTCIWGIGLGIGYVLNPSLFSMLMPGGRESVMFGIKVTFAKAFTWLPPLLFTTWNENDWFGGLQYSLFLIAPGFFIGALITSFVDEEKGKQEIAHTMHLRRGSFNAADMGVDTAAPLSEMVAAEPADGDDDEVKGGPSAKVADIEADDSESDNL